MRGEREREFWDEHVPALERLARRYERGAEPNTAAMIDAVEPLQGKRVLDFACGAGLTSAYLAQRGAQVTAIDISPESIARGRELAERTGQQIEFLAGELGARTFAPGVFDAVIGRYALHHVHLPTIAPILNELLAPGGRGAFLETMALNPLLNFSRRRLAGRGGVASYGSEDERPIDRNDLRVLGDAFASVELGVGEMRFLRIFDRNVLRYRHRRAARVLGVLDDGLLRLGLGALSYHQIVKVTKRS
ncbi:MAG TPA: class I SAM-dependent methyltransferase [Solirubrobacteraceae bacterium]|jgi:SAM-dependent methyltransferase